MDIIKIKNVKYSVSTNKENVLRVEFVSTLNRMLVETDWTQLPDVGLTLHSRCGWAQWRDDVRNLKKHNVVMDITDFSNAMVELQNHKVTIPIDYMQFDDLEDSKNYLHGLLISNYTNHINTKVSPTLELKYREALDIISAYVADSESPISVNSLDMDGLVDYIKTIPLIEMDISGYPFFSLTMKLKNFTINQTIIHIITDMSDQFNFSLQEEYKLIHYEHKIASCAGADDVRDTKIEIELNYGR